MYRCIWIVLVILLLGVWQANLSAQNAAEVYREGEMYVKICPDLRLHLPDYRHDKSGNLATYPLLGNLIETYGITAINRPFKRLNAPDLNNVYQISFAQTAKTDQLWRELTNLPQVEFAEKVPLDQIFDAPNDPLLNNGEQDYLTLINTIEALDLGLGAANVVIAIVDDAISTTHEDLTPCIYTNSAEIPGNGIDDDGNGLIDDVNGWDFADFDNNPNPPGNASAASFSHGTHCAGTAGAATNNGLGIASLGSGVKIMPIKCTANLSANTALITHGWQGVEYAIQQGADVISISWGSTVYSSVYHSLVSYAHNQGIVIVAAAGNANTDTPFYPAAYEQVIAVAACDNTGKKASFSNYGSWIDITAPGANIKSAIAGNVGAYGIKNGTSMAAPLVSGLCALMLSHNNTLTPTQITNCLLNAATNINAQNPDYLGKLGAGLVNAYQSVLCAMPASGCVAPAGLHAATVGAASATLQWQNINGAALYTLQYKPTGAANWISKNTETASLPITDLAPCTPYEYRVKTVCTGAQPSAFSDPYTFTTTAQGMVGYCQSYALNSAAEWIGQVALNDLLYTAGSTSGNVGYENMTCSMANLQMGSSYNISLSPAFAATPYNEYWRVWIDLNQNGSFTDAGELVFDSGSLSASVVSGVLLVPTTANTGKTTMRVAMKWVGSADFDLPQPCNSFAMGQVKDFGINITAPPVSNCQSAQNLSAQDITYQSAAIYCTAPASGSYTLEYRANGQANWQSIMGISGFPYTLPGLLAATGYQYRIKRQCSGSVSDYSPTGYFTTAQPPCNAPDNASAQGITNVAATITWSSVLGAATYEIRYRQQGSSAAWLLTTVSGYSATLAGLAPGTSYEYQIRSICSVANVGVFSAIFTFTTAGSCLTPTGIVATGITPAGATIQWNAQAGVASYQLRYRKQGLTEWQNVIAATNSLQLTALEPAATYEVRVRTVCDAGSSSAFSVVYTFATSGINVCAVPTGLNAMSAGINNAELVWQPVSGALSYEVQYRLWSSSTWTTLGAIAATGVSLNGLNAGATYVCRVKTNCAGGGSANSGEITFTTADVLALCGMPQNLTATATGNPATVAIQWAAEAAAQTYQLQYGIWGSNTWVTISVAGNNYVLNNLTGCTQYAFRIKSVCSGSTSNFSSPILFTTACTTPITGTAIALAYCPLQGNNATHEWIAGVQIADLNNVSGSNGGYGNFTQLSADLAAGSTYAITLMPGFAGTAFNEYWRVWIDLNADGDFADEGELVFDTGTASNAPVTGLITIPVSATVGNTRMRVAMRFKNPVATPCGVYSFGETEDYTVNITAAGIVQEILPDAPTTAAQQPDCAALNLAIAFDYEVDGQTVSFTNLSEGNFDTVLWSFGDGHSSDELNPAHQYTQAGDYFFLLTIINSDTGCLQQYEGYVYITQPGTGMGIEHTQQGDN